MAIVTKPIALDESLHTTEQTPRNLADVLAQALQMLNTTISGLNFINCVVVQTLPTTDISTTTIYLVPKNPSQTDNLYDEYINLTGTPAGWEKIGDTEIDLSGYYTSAEVDDLLADKADVSDIPTVNDGTLTIQQNGDTKGTFTANQSGNSTVNIEIPTTDIQTAVDEFSTYNGGILDSLKVSLSPNQDLHGYDSPWVGGSRKNKAPLVDKAGYGLTFVADELLGKMTMTGLATGDGWGAGIMVQINLPVGSYICSATNNPNNAQVLINYNPQGVVTSSGVTFNVTDATQNIRVAWLIASGTTYNNVIEGLMIRSASESDPTFEPYSNICPISGHTESKVGDDGKNRFNPNDLILGKYFNSDGTLGEYAGWNCVYINVEPNTTYTISGLSPNGGTYFCYFDKSKNFISNGGTHQNATLTTPNGCYLLGIEVLANGTEDNVQVEKGSTATPYEPYNGYQVTVNLGGTYYSGILDVVTGVFTPDTASDDLGTLTWQTRYTGSVNKTLSSSLSQKPLWAETAGEVQCEDYKYNGKVGGASILSDPDNCEVGLYLYYVPTQEGNAKVCYLVIPVDNSPNDKVVYELNDTTPIQLIPTPIKANVRENHLSAPLDGQTVDEVKYKEVFTFDDVDARVESTYSMGISHNSVYRGKYLGDHVTAEQWDAIGNGTFKDLYIGDYWTINGMNWRIAHFNYWLMTGDVKCNTNHVVIVPYGSLSNFSMNDTDDTTGGYLNSKWYTTNRHYAVENVENAFGASHILSHRNFFSNAVTDGVASGGQWVDSTVDLMNEIMVYGHSPYSYLGRIFETGVDTSQLALFRYNTQNMTLETTNRVTYWFRGVASATAFAVHGNYGLPDRFNASQNNRIRPAFAIKK